MPWARRLTSRRRGIHEVPSEGSGLVAASIMPIEEIFLPFRVPEPTLGQATHVRSTLIASSIASLRQHGLFERYQPLLSPRHRDAVLSTVAGVWLPMDVARAHYEACDGLGLRTEEQVQIGMEVSAKIHETFLGTVLRMAKQAGVTPWVLLGRGHQMFARLFDGGGGLRVIKYGPKEARADVCGVPLLAVPYFRHAMRGIYHAGVSIFCEKAYVLEIARDSAPTRGALKLSWV